MLTIYRQQPMGSFSPILLDEKTCREIASQLPAHISAEYIQRWGREATHGEFFVIDLHTRLVALNVEPRYSPGAYRVTRSGR